MIQKLENMSQSPSKMSRRTKNLEKVGKNIASPKKTYALPKVVKPKRVKKETLLESYSRPARHSSVEKVLKRGNNHLGASGSSRNTKNVTNEYQNADLDK